MKSKQPELRKIRLQFTLGEASIVETPWAEVITPPDVVRIANIPFLSNQAAYEDHVRIDDEGNVLEVLEHVNRTRRAMFNAALERKIAQRQMDSIVKYLRARKIECESAVPGIIAISIPLEISDEQFDEFVKACPVPLQLVVEKNK